MIVLSGSYTYMVIIVPITIIAPLAVGLPKFNHGSPTIKLLILYLLLSGIFNLGAAILAAKRINNLPFLHLFTAFELIILCLFYKHVFNSKKITRVIYTLMSVFFIFSIINSFFFENVFTYNSYARSLEAIIILSIALYYFKNSLDRYTNDTVTQKPLFYFNSAFIVYFGGSFFLFISANLIRKNIVLNTVMWNIHATLVLIMYILFTIGLLHVKKLR
jgi:hypothetical protein